MSATGALKELDFEVIVEDGVPVEKTVHLLSMMLFRHVAQNRLRELGPDFYVGANQFVYYSLDQARTVAEEERQLTLFDEGLRPDEPKKVAFRGPDAFIVRGVPNLERDAWMAWEEDGRLPDLILELLSPSTAKVDYGEKKRLYQDVFKASEYFLYEPRSEMPDGYRLLDHTYQRIPHSSEGRLWSSLLQVEIGVWHGEYDGIEGPWLRLFYPDGRLVLTDKELANHRAEQQQQAREAAEQEKEAAEQEKEVAVERANAAEIENVRLLARLANLEGQDDEPG